MIKTHLENIKFYVIFAFVIIALYAKFLDKSRTIRHMSDARVIYNMLVVWVGAFVLNMIIHDVYEAISPHVLKLVKKLKILN